MTRWVVFAVVGVVMASSCTTVEPRDEQWRTTRVVFEPATQAESPLECISLLREAELSVYDDPDFAILKVRARVKPGIPTVFRLRLPIGRLGFLVQGYSSTGYVLLQGSSTDSVSGSSFLIPIPVSWRTGSLRLCPGRAVLDDVNAGREILTLTNPGTADVNWFVGSGSNKPTNGFPLYEFIPSDGLLGAGESVDVEVSGYSEERREVLVQLSCEFGSVDFPMSIDFYPTAADTLERAAAGQREMDRAFSRASGGARPGNRDLQGL